MSRSDLRRHPRRRGPSGSEGEAAGRLTSCDGGFGITPSLAPLPICSGGAAEGGAKTGAGALLIGGSCGAERLEPFRPARIISGGQTGVDRGALEAAIAFGIEHGGWCPRGRLSEDGSVPSRYNLRETDSCDYALRTERNIIDSDATLILYEGQLRGGTLLTKRIAARLKKPWVAVPLAPQFDPEAVRRWLRETRPQVLNVAGPRASSHEGIEERARCALLSVLAD